MSVLPNTIKMDSIYGVPVVPTVVVVRNDGAAAAIHPAITDTSPAGEGLATVDFNVVNNAITEALAWQQSHPNSVSRS